MITEEDALTYYLPVFFTEFETEAEFLDVVNEFLSMLPATKVVRANINNKSGISDLLVCYHGLFVALELKDNTGEPSKQQLKFIADIKQAGGRGAVCSTLAEVYNTLRNGD